MRCLLILCCLFCSEAVAQSSLSAPTTDTFYYTTGAGRLTITLTSYGDTTVPFFIRLHDNEHTAKEATHATLRQRGGRFLNIDNDGERIIRFNFDTTTYQFDPNRIFTDTGIVRTLEAFGPESDSAFNLVKGFAAFILSYIPEATPVIAVHNNTPDNLSILSYKRGGRFYSDAAHTHVARGTDADDFFLTTDRHAYHHLKRAGFNVTLQDNDNVDDDGSLSVYYGSQGGWYINIEAEHGHLNEQQRMIEAVLEMLDY